MLSTHGYRKKNGCSTLNALVRIHSINALRISYHSERTTNDYGVTANNVYVKAEKRVWGRSKRVADRLLALRHKH